MERLKIIVALWRMLTSKHFVLMTSKDMRTVRYVNENMTMHRMKMFANDMTEYADEFETECANIDEVNKIIGNN